MPSPFDALTPDARGYLKQIFSAIGYTYNRCENGDISSLTALNEIADFIKPIWYDLLTAAERAHDRSN